MNNMVIGGSLLIIGLIMTTFGGVIFKKGYDSFTENKDDKPVSRKEAREEQNLKDTQTALLYQTQLSHFLFLFKICLNYSLPLDNEANNVFHYVGPDSNKPIDLAKMNRKLISRIFTEYDFRKPMINYTPGKFHPTGYNNLLGEFEYLDAELQDMMNKFGSNTSVDLATKIEFLSKSIKNTTLSIRMDIKNNKLTNLQDAEIIANTILLIRDDFQFLVENYTTGVEGGFPVMVGKVTKAGKSDGQLQVESHFSGY